MSACTSPWLGSLVLTKTGANKFDGLSAHRTERKLGGKAEALAPRGGERLGLNINYRGIRLGFTALSGRGTTPARPPPCGARPRRKPTQS